MVNRAEMTALATWCNARGVRLISDEIYHGIVYEGEAVSAAEVTDQAIVVNSFSKYFSMTGWRVGWLVVPPELVRPIERLSQNLFISVPTLSQHAALAAFDCREELDGHVRRYRANRDLLMAGLPAVGLDRLAPAQGAFYLYADIAHLTNDSRDFCKRMLAEAGVATTPGVDFDRARGAGTLRISFAGSTNEMEEAVRRLKAWRRT
jgi:aspartate/methionine/tyrosine aminotransferase